MDTDSELSQPEPLSTTHSESGSLSPTPLLSEASQRVIVNVDTSPSPRPPRDSISTRLQARDAQITMLKRALQHSEEEMATLKQAHDKNKILSELVDVLMEQKAIMHGKIKSLEWKVARGRGDINHDMGVESLADREKYLIRRLGIPIMGDERGIIKFRRA